MAEYVLSCCSTADLSREHFLARDIHYICFHYQLDGVDYPDDLGQSMSFPKFYEAMKNGADTRTSAINADEFEQYFETFLKAGKDVLHLCLSGGITSTMNGATMAKEVLEAKYPDRKIIVIDSKAASSGYGLLMDELADRRDAGMGLQELAAWAEENKLNVHHWFFSTDLTFFIKGGRVSKTSGYLGMMLNICPLLNVDSDGCLIPREKIRTKRKVIHTIVDRMEQHAQDGLNYSGKVFMSHSACAQDAQEVARLVKERFPNIQGEVLINDIGTTIGSHTGPGTVALFFMGDVRTK